MHDTYLRDVKLVSQEVGERIDPTTQMGVRIEIDEASVGVMVALSGAEVLLLAQCCVSLELQQPKQTTPTVRPVPESQIRIPERRKG